MLAVINRLQKSSKQTLGHMTVYDGIHDIFECKVLELPDKNNQQQISRIPVGEYTCVSRWSEKYGNHYHVLDVDGRSLILIHFGNYYSNTRGCLLVGKDFYDINSDGYLDVTSSKDTMRRFLGATRSVKLKLIVNDYE